MGQIDRPPLETTLAHAVVGVGGLVQAEALDVGADLAGAGEVEHLAQLDRRPPVGDRQLGLEGEGPEGELEFPPGEADDGDVALEARDSGGEGDRVIGADHVEHQLGAEAGGQLADLRGGVLARLDRLVGANLAGQP